MIKKLGKATVLLVLRTLAFIQLKKYRAKIVGITGSVGKTSLTEACALVLKNRFNLLKLREGYNSEFGVPLVILDQKSGFSSPTAWMKTLLGCLKKVFFDWKRYDLVLLEMGVDKPNDMKYLTSFIKPFASIFLNVAPVHIENFEPTRDSLKDIFEEKSILIKKTKPEGFVVLNYDDPMIRSLEGKLKPRIIWWFGSGVPRGNYSRSGFLKTLRERKRNGNLIFKDISINSKGLLFQIEIDKKKQQVFIPNIFGKEYAYTFSAAIALGLGFNIPPEESIEAIKDFKLPPGRLNILKGIKDTILIDGSYNASRLSMIQGLGVLKLHKKRKKIAVLGDMRELGEYAEKEHKVVAREAIKVADKLILLGPLMKKYFYPEAIKLGFNKKCIYHFKKAGEVLEFLKKHLEGKEVILLKGSQNTIFLEIVVEGLLTNKSDASLLCRRGQEWTRFRKPYR